MKILSSGSFINLDNQEKVEQLIFTAREIAGAAVETDGFVSSEENNKRLALEIWQGAEYMTREHERARIQNVFINNFLERLGEIAPTAATTTNSLPENSESLTAEMSSPSPDVPKDEFLGFVNTTTENESRQVTETDDNFGEKTQATNSVEVLSPDREFVENAQEQNLETEAVESAASLTAEMPIIEDESEIVKPVEPNQATENKITDVFQIEKDEKTAIAAITLSEKEPYRWDDCTVTATIQMLPAQTGVRKIVLSVRTHDFAPQISVVEFGGAATPEKISPALEKAFERYKTDLPVKVMDKMKKEKSAGKKHADKTAVETKTSSAVAKPAVGTETQIAMKTVQTSVPKTENNQASMPAASASQTVVSQTNATASRNKTSAKNSKPMDNAQGNLFGF